MMTFPLAESILRKTPLQNLVMVDQVIADLYGYTTFIVDHRAVAVTLRRHYSYADLRTSDPAMEFAVELVEERLAALPV